MSINNQQSYSQVFAKLCSAHRVIGKNFLFLSLAARCSYFSSCICHCSDITPSVRLSENKLGV